MELPFKIEWGKVIGIKGDIRSDDIKDIDIIFFNKTVKSPWGFKIKHYKKRKLRQKDTEGNEKDTEKEKTTLNTKLKKAKIAGKELIYLLLNYIREVLKTIAFQCYNDKYS